MNKDWSLDILYKGYDDEAFISDFKKTDTVIKQLHELAEKLPSMQAEEGIVAIIQAYEEVQILINNLAHYVSLRQSTDTTNTETAALMGQLMQKGAETAKDEVIFSKFIAECPNLDELIAKNPLLKEYEFFLHETKDKVEHMLSDEVEDMVSKMGLTGGNAWGDLFDYLTSTVEVDYNGEVVPLPYIRSLAHDPDPEVRKKAYEAELASYKKIEAPISFALNNIKKQVTMLSKARGYESPLAMTLKQSRMSQATLDALWTAVNEYLPKFREYLKAKAAYLGYKNGLPWYELYAPVGQSSSKFTTEDAKKYLLDRFSNFSDDMADMMTHAFDDAWIDFFPHAGKVGGAFCANLPEQKQSRVLTNFNGSLSDVDTLAHELGHAYHGLHVQDHRPLNRDYTMPVAETASTFNENVLMSFAIDAAEGDEKLALIESQLQDENQTICDIYSRFLFESAVFEQSTDQFLFPDQLKELMIDAQIKSYGDGLDPEYRHPYMWANKGHYYSAGLSFYNFPYAFGSLFAKGLYAMYKKEGSSFVEKYQKMLHATTIHTVEDTAKVMGVDITKPDFWRSSLELIANNIDEFIRLTKK